MLVTTLLSCRVLERNSECKVTSNRFFLFKADAQRPAVAVQ
jgi:hypothetical protein